MDRQAKEPPPPRHQWWEAARHHPVLPLLQQCKAAYPKTTLTLRYQCGFGAPNSPKSPKSQFGVKEPKQAGRAMLFLRKLTSMPWASIHANGGRIHCAWKCHASNDLQSETAMLTTVYCTNHHAKQMDHVIHMFSQCQALLLLCLSLVPSNLEPFRNQNFNHRSNPSPNICSKSGVSLQSEQTACGLFFEKPAPQSHINLASPPFHNVIDDHFHPSKVTGWSEWCCTAGAHPGQVCQVENPDATENKENIWHSMV